MLLVLDEPDHPRQLRMRIRTHPESLLPIEAPHDPAAPVAAIRRAGLDRPDQLRQRQVGLVAHQQVGVVGHAMDGLRFLPPRAEYPGHVILELFLVLGTEEVLTPFRCEHDLNARSRRGVGHRSTGVAQY